MHGGIGQCRQYRTLQGVAEQRMVVGNQDIGH
jgi:hypothetical protein